MPKSASRLSIILAAAVFVVAVAFAIGVQSVRHNPVAVTVSNAVGDATCLSCHQMMADFETTAHHLTSRLPSSAAITGTFAAGANVLRTSNPQLYFRMDSTSDGFFQTAVFGSAPDTSVRTERIAFVTGSGRRGQSFLYWREHDLLYQLPVSWWASFGWGNSPAYRDGRPNFDRPIPPRCLECHATAFESAADSIAENRYRPTNAILGLTCETCHASGQTHVARQRSLAAAVLPTAIVNPARLSRERQLDACALCHGGATELESVPFAHVPGTPVVKKLDLEIWRRPASPSVDVHGDQIGLLARSRCFQQSQMTCTTCHDVHREQRDAGALSSRCLTCHTVRSCDLFPREGRALEGRCADCHMPVLPSTSVVANHVGEQIRQLVRSHWIRVYPEFSSLPITSDRD